MTISICIPFYLRGDYDNLALRRTFKHYSSLGYTLHLCGSEVAMSRTFAQPFLNKNTFYFEVPQNAFCNSSGGDDHLRKKFNDSLKTLPDTDWRCLVGADDIVPADFFTNLEYRNANRIAMAGIASDQPLMIVPHKESIPPFKVKLNYKVSLLPGVNAFSRAGWEFCKGNPYRLKGCETGAERYFRANGHIVSIPGYVIMLKGKNNLNTTEKIMRVHEHEVLNEQELELIKQYL